MSVERVLLTNDDGIDAVGLRALYDGLSADYDVVTVAPTGDRSSAGRALSDGVDIADHELGYAVDGTPVDCVVAGLDALVPDADVVVAGCNKGANLGAYTLGRSGTVSAAVEAAFFDVPAVATSMYVPGGEDWWKRKLEPAEFANATRATRYLVAEATASGAFDRADYLNVNAPIRESGRRARHPSADARHRALDMVRDGGGTRRKRSRELLRPDLGKNERGRCARLGRHRSPGGHRWGSLRLPAVGAARGRARRGARRAGGGVRTRDRERSMTNCSETTPRRR